MSEGRFHPLFEQWAGRIRRRLIFRGALSGAALGLVLALVPAVAGWRLHASALLRVAPTLGLFGAAAGAIAVARRRWADPEVAMYLDARLGTDEAIVTAVELRNVPELDAPTRNAVVSVASDALAKAEPKKVSPRLWISSHALIPAAAAALVAVALAPMPAIPAPKLPPGSGLVTSKDAEQLKRLAEIGKISARDEAQKKRLDEIAKAAEALRKDLDKGLPKRDALDRISKLRDAIAKERLSLGEGESRQGMDSAMSKLRESDVTRDASKALGDHDMQRFDDEMERIANEREKADRELAKKKLDEAIGEARKNGAEDVAKALENSKKGFEARERRAQQLRDLADALKDSGIKSPEAGEVEKQADALDRKGTDEAAKKLADAMGKALDKLTPEERERLKKNIQKKLEGQGGKSGVQDPARMKELAEDLATPEGQKKLEEKLKELAKEDDESDESKTDKSLDDAEKDAEDAEKDLGKQPGQGEQGQPGQGEKPGQKPGQKPGEDPGQGKDPGEDQMPGKKPNQGEGPGQQPGQGQGSGQGLDGVPLPMPGGSPGAGQGGGPGDGKDGAGGTGKGGGPTNKGKAPPTAKVDGDTLHSKARSKMNKGQGVSGGTQQGTMPGRASGKSRAELSGDLSTVGPKEIDGVTHGDIPEEYRDQVREYFQP